MLSDNKIIQLYAAYIFRRYRIVNPDIKQQRDPEPPSIRKRNRPSLELCTLFFIIFFVVFHEHIIKSCTDSQCSVGNYYWVRWENSAKALHCTSLPIMNSAVGYISIVFVASDDNHAMMDCGYMISKVITRGNNYTGFRIVLLIIPQSYINSLAVNKCFMKPKN